MFARLTSVAVLFGEAVAAAAVTVARKPALALALAVARLPPPWPPCWPCACWRRRRWWPSWLADADEWHLRLAAAHCAGSEGLHAAVPHPGTAQLVVCLYLSCLLYVWNITYVTTRTKALTIQNVSQRDEERGEDGNKM